MIPVFLAAVPLLYPWPMVCVAIEATDIAPVVERTAVCIPRDRKTGPGSRGVARPVTAHGKGPWSAVLAIHPTADMVFLRGRKGTKHYLIRGSSRSRQAGWMGGGIAVLSGGHLREAGQR